MKQLTQHIDIEVYPHDLGEHTWDDAVRLCNELGDGWRMPTREELHLMWLNKDNSFAAAYYWSSSEYGNNFAWGQDFGNGGQDYYYKDFPDAVRAVRDIK